MAGTGRSTLIGADRRTGVRQFDWLLLLSALVLMLAGFIALYSVGVRMGAGTFRKQVAMAIVGLVPFAIFYLRQPLKLDYLWAALCILGAVYFMFRGTAPTT